MSRFEMNGWVMLLACLVFALTIGAAGVGLIYIVMSAIGGAASFFGVI
jgi:hypothetical protein